MYYYKICKPTQGGVKRVKNVKGLKVQFIGFNNTITLYEPLPKFKNCFITLRKNSSVEIGSSKYTINNLQIKGQADNQIVKIGTDFSCTDNCQILFSREEDLQVQIGNNCMFAPNIELRPCDGHVIADMNDNKILNWGRNITIKDNVWLGHNVTVLKGVTIERNCIVGYGSLVTKSCDKENSIYAGFPAKIVKEGIIWDRKTPAEFIAKGN